MRKFCLFTLIFGLILVFCVVYKFTPKISTYLSLHSSAFADSSLVEDSTPLDSLSLSSLDGNFVTIFDDGTKKVIKTDSKTVADVLERLSLTLSPDDYVSPELNAKIDSNYFFINIYRAHPILVESGTTRKIANVASSDPLTAVRAAGFIVFDDDKIELISPNNADFLETGISTAYRLTRGEGTTIVEESDIPFETETIRDYNLPVGAEEVRTYGELGRLRQTYKAQTISGEVVEKELLTEEILRTPVNRVVAVGTAIKDATPLSVSMGRNRYTAKNLAGEYVERQETFYDLPMSVVMSFCGQSSYTVRADGAKVDSDGYVLVAANLSRYPRCSIVETSLGLGKVYDTGGFAVSNPEQFDLATDWTNRDGI